jgi:hypothetical protein
VKAKAFCFLMNNKKQIHLESNEKTNLKRKYSKNDDNNNAEIWG